MATHPIGEKNRIRQYRLAHRPEPLTLKQLAAMSGLSLGTVHLIDNQRVAYTRPITREKLARALNVPREVLFPLVEEPAEATA